MTRRSHVRPLVDEPDESALSLLVGALVLVALFVVAFVLLPLIGAGQP